MISGTSPGGPQILRPHPGEGNTLIPGPSNSYHKHQFADLQTAGSRYQTGKLPTADCWTRKPDCQPVIEGLEGLGTGCLPNIPRSLVAPDKQGPADFLIRFHWAASRGPRIDSRGPGI